MVPKVVSFNLEALAEFRVSVSIGTNFRMGLLQGAGICEVTTGSGGEFHKKNDGDIKK